MRVYLCASVSISEPSDAVIRQNVFGPAALYGSGRISILSSQLEAGLKSRSARQTGTTGVQSQIETPLQRYTRLNAEVSALHDELRAVAEAAGSNGTQTPSVGYSSDGGMWQSLHNGTAALQQQLAEIGPHLAAVQLGASASSAAEGRGTTWYEDALSRLLQVQTTAADPLPSPHPLPSPQPATAAQHHRSLAVTPSVTEAQLIDARIAALEALIIGTSQSTQRTASPAAFGAEDAVSNSSTGSSGLIARLDALDGAIAMLQPQALQDLADRAEAALRILKAEAAQGGGRAPGSLTSGSHGFIATTERVGSAIKSLELCDAASAAVPVLAGRLASLDKVHREAALFTQRLALAEAAVGATDQRLARDEALLAELREGLAEAAAAMAHNVREMREIVGQKI